MRTKLKGYRLIEFKRPITHVKYNLDCDLFLASSKAKNIYSWRGDAFEPLNSYEGHKGSINDFCIQDDSKLIISASADNSLMIFDTETAAVINKLTEKGPFTHCGISLSRQMFFYIYVSGIDSYSLNVRELNGDITLIFQKEGKGLPTCAMWGYLDEQIIIGLENGQLIIFDLCTKNIKPIQAHKSSISDIQMSRDYMHFITCSTDSTVLFWDASTYNYNKYETNVNLNSVSLSPFKDYFICTGGVPPSEVTQTKANTTDIFFYDILSGKKFGRVISPHNGPIHTLCIRPDGKGFSSGSEDSTINTYLFEDHPTFSVN